MPEPGCLMNWKALSICSVSQREGLVLMFTVLALQMNSCDQNLNHCLELIEQVAKVQGQLFRILTTAAQEGEGGQFCPIQLSLLFAFLCTL